MFRAIFAHRQERETESFTAYGNLLLWWAGSRLPAHHNYRLPYAVKISVSRSRRWAKIARNMLS